MTLTRKLASYDMTTCDQAFWNWERGAAVRDRLDPLRTFNSGLEVRARTGTERDVELVPQEQVLDHMVVPSAKEPGQFGEEEAD